MKLSAEDKERVEAYAASLLEAARAEGRELEDLKMIDHLAESLVELNDAMREIIEQGDAGLLPLISERYSALFREQQTGVTCNVTTAVPLSETLRAEVLTFLQAEYGQTIHLNETVDPSILGGIIVSAEGERKDASVRTQLENLRRELKQRESEEQDEGEGGASTATAAEFAPEAELPASEYPVTTVMAHADAQNTSGERAQSKANAQPEGM